MSRLATFGLLSVLLATSSLQARDLVVDNVNGSDSQNDRGKVLGPATYGPYRTINRALKGALPGDRIVLTNTGEPYRECIALAGPQHSGAPGAPFEIVGNGATLDGSHIPLPENWIAKQRGIWELQPAPAGFGMLILDGQPLPYQELETPDLSQLKPMHWTRSDARIYFRPEENRGPFDYALEITTQTTGVTLYDVRHVVIRDLTVRGYRLDGIQAHSRSRNVTILGVTTQHNGRAGITVANDCRARIGATLSQQNGTAQLRVEGRGVAEIGNVDFAEENGPAVITADHGRVVKLERE